MFRKGFLLLLWMVLAFNTYTFAQTEATEETPNPSQEVTTENKVDEEDVVVDEGLSIKKSELERLQKDIWHTKLVHEVFKSQNRPSITINIDKEIQEDLLGSRITLSFSNKEYYVSSKENIVMQLEQTEYLNFLDMASEQVDGDYIPVRITIYTNKEEIQIHYSPFKNKKNTSKADYQFYLFLKKKNWEYVASELDMNNISSIKDDNIDLTNERVTTKIENYSIEVEKKIPWFGWFTTTLALFVSVLLPIDAFILVLVFWFFFKRLKNKKLPDE